MRLKLPQVKCLALAPTSTHCYTEELSSTWVWVGTVHIQIITSFKVFIWILAQIGNKHSGPSPGDNILISISNHKIVASLEENLGKVLQRDEMSITSINSMYQRPSSNVQEIVGFWTTLMGWGWEFTPFYVKGWRFFSLSCLAALLSPYFSPGLH